MALRPSPALVAKWYARLPEGSNIEDARGNITVGNRRVKHIPIAMFGGGELGRDNGLGVSPILKRIAGPGALPQFGAASWRMPRIAGIVDVRGAGPHARRGQFRRRLTLGRQRRILRLLADGASVRQVMAVVRTSPVVIVAVRKAALAWRDPDDAE